MGREGEAGFRVGVGPTILGIIGLFSQRIDIVFQAFLSRSIKLLDTF